MKLSALALLLISSILISSCAYMQTHKNIEQWGTYQDGFKVIKPDYIYLSQGDWYIKTEQYKLQRHYPIVHDSVFLEIMDYKLIPISQCEGIVYHRISQGTATVLQRKDGYATLSTLSKEIERDAHCGHSTLPHASKKHVRALIHAGKDTDLVIKKPVEPSPSFGVKTLSNLDLVFVDTPGTIIYNIAIPFAAPFVFFYSLSKDEQNNPILNDIHKEETY